MTNGAKLILIRKRDSKSLAELVQEVLDMLVQTRMGAFANDLDCARAMWRKHRDLVECRRFPKELRAALKSEFQVEPGNFGLSDEFMHPRFRESLRPEAIEFARARMRREVAANA